MRWAHFRQERTSSAINRREVVGVGFRCVCDGEGEICVSDGDIGLLNKVLPRLAVVRGVGIVWVDFGRTSIWVVVFCFLLLTICCVSAVVCGGLGLKQRKQLEITCMAWL